MMHGEFFTICITGMDNGSKSGDFPGFNFILQKLKHIDSTLIE